MGLDTFPWDPELRYIDALLPSTGSPPGACRRAEGWKNSSQPTVARFHNPDWGLDRASPFARATGDRMVDMNLRQGYGSQALRSSGACQPPLPRLRCPVPVAPITSG